MSINRGLETEPVPVSTMSIMFDRKKKGSHLAPYCTRTLQVYDIALNGKKAGL